VFIGLPFTRRTQTKQQSSFTRIDEHVPIRKEASSGEVGSSHKNAKIGADWDSNPGPPSLKALLYPKMEC
jgi:hypothetical protein